MEVSLLGVSKPSSGCVLLKGKRIKRCMRKLLKAPNTSVRIQKSLAFHMFEGQAFYIVSPKNYFPQNLPLEASGFQCFLSHHLYLSSNNCTGSSKNFISFIIRFHARSRLQSFSINSCHTLKTKLSVLPRRVCEGGQACKAALCSVLLRVWTQNSPCSSWISPGFIDMDSWQRHPWIHRNPGLVCEQCWSPGLQGSSWHIQKSAWTMQQLGFVPFPTAVLVIVTEILIRRVKRTLISDFRETVWYRGGAQNVLSSMKMDQALRADLQPPRKGFTKIARRLVGSALKSKRF